MKSRNVQVRGTEFSVGKNVCIRAVKLRGEPVQWRKHKTKPNCIELRKPLNATVSVEYDVLEQVEVAAYYPLQPRKPQSTVTALTETTHG